MLFQPEHIVATAGVHARMVENEHFAEFVSTSINRHLNGDWSQATTPEDQEANNYALTAGERLLSAYIDEKLMIKIWVITEADRSATTALFPDEY